MHTLRWLLLSCAMPWASGAFAQATVGAILDAGAKPLSAADFQKEVVQRVIVGPAATGGRVEMMYVQNGSLSGIGTITSAGSSRMPPEQPIAGEWKIGEREAVCATMRIVVSSSGGWMQLPIRCQYWFKLGDKYFFADSDTDRSAKVLMRTIKQ